MAATITNFRTALHSPSNYLRTLFEASVAECSAVSRTSEFAEVFILWHSQRYLLSLPLSSQALHRARLSSVALRTLLSERILHYRILSDELEYLDSRRSLNHADLILEQIPQGEALSDCVQKFDAQQLLAALDELEAEFRRLSLSLPNLKAENIIVTPRCELYPIRLHYASIQADASSAEFKTLREYVCAELGVDVNKCSAHRGLEPEPLNALYGYKSVGNPFEGMCVAESTQGYGYISDQGEEIIAPIYLWANDMREGRAEVETPSGMGLIDSQGNYIIEPHYQIVEFDPRTGLSQVKKEDQWSWRDYEGREIER